MGQLSFYSADAHPRALSDLEGVLCGPGQAVMFGRGTTARLSIVLGPPPPPPPTPEDDEAGQDEDGIAPADPDPDRDADPEVDHDVRALDPADLEFLDLDPDELAAVFAPPPRTPRTPAPARRVPPAVVGTSALAVAPPARPAPRYVPDPVTQWRARTLRCAFRTRGIDAELDHAPDGRPLVRSAFRADLVDLAARWTRDAVKTVPPEVELDGPRLRLWVLAAGRRVGRAYLLGLDPDAEHTHGPLLAASRRAGLGATLGGDRQEPCLRIVGTRRHRRLAELVGDPPGEPPPEVWPE